MDWPPSLLVNLKVFPYRSSISDLCCTVAAIPILDPLAHGQHWANRAELEFIKTSARTDSHILLVCFPYRKGKLYCVYFRWQFVLLHCRREWSASSCQKDEMLPLLGKMFHSKKEVICTVCLVILLDVETYCSVTADDSAPHTDT